MTFLDIASVLSPTAPLRVRVVWVLSVHFPADPISTRACVIHHHLVIKGQTFWGLRVAGKRTCTYVLLTKSRFFSSHMVSKKNRLPATLTHFKYIHGGRSWRKNDSYVYMWLPAALLRLSFGGSWDGPHWAVKPFIIFIPGCKCPSFFSCSLSLWLIRKERK